MIIHVPIIFVTIISRFNSNSPLQGIDSEHNARMSMAPISFLFGYRRHQLFIERTVGNRIEFPTVRIVVDEVLSTMQIPSTGADDLSLAHRSIGIHGECGILLVYCIIR